MIEGLPVASDLLHVIILNWNGEGVIEECLESLEKSEYRPMTVTVVDNASTDSSCDIIERSFPGVNLIRNEENLLFAAGNNVGISKALKGEADYILLLNNDTVVGPRFAYRMIEAFDMPEAGIVGPKILYFDDPQRIWYGGGGFYPILGVPKHENIRKSDSEGAEKVTETGYVTGCAMMVKKEVFEDAGLLDPSYRIYCEDVDFCLRAARAGWKCYYAPEARIWHKVSSSSGGGFTPFKLENRIVSTAKLFSRHRPWWWRVLVFPFHALAFVLMLIFLLLSGKWKLFKGAFRGLAGVLVGER